MIHLKKCRAKANFLFFLIILSAFAHNRSSAQALTQFYGVNAWNNVQNNGNYNSYLSNPLLLNFRNNGNSNSLNAEMVRIGGIEYDYMQYSVGDYSTELAFLSSSNLTPIVQIGVAEAINQVWQTNSGATWSNLLSTILASNSTYKNYVGNLVYQLLINEGVRFWSIGNEPDGWASKFGNPNALTFLHTNFSTNPVTATEIARYTKDIAGFVRGIYAAHNATTAPAQQIFCKILGPDLAWDNFTSSSNCLFKLLSTQGSPNNIWVPSTMNGLDYIVSLRSTTR